MFDDSQGSAYTGVQRTLKTGNLTLIRNAAAELPRVDRGDALAVCVVIRRAEPQHFEWLATLLRGATRGHARPIQAAAWAVDNSNDEPAALETLERLCAR